MIFGLYIHPLLLTFVLSPTYYRNFSMEISPSCPTSASLHPADSVKVPPTGPLTSLACILYIQLLTSSLGVNTPMNNSVC